MSASEHAWFNGALVHRQFADPSVASNTLHLGIAVFDGLMAYWNRNHWHLHRDTDHIRRFIDGASNMDLQPQWTLDEIISGIYELLETLPEATHYIRPIAYRRSPQVFFETPEDDSNICVFATPVDRDSEAAYTCEISPIQRVPFNAIPAAWKVSGAYANSYLAERHAHANGFDTGLMLDSAGCIAEASASNVFFADGANLVTPKLNGDVFPGITRSIVIEIARKMGVPVSERDVRPHELPSFDAAFICGTLAELRPISYVGEHQYASADHVVVRRIVTEFRKLTHQ